MKGRYRAKHFREYGTYRVQKTSFGYSVPLPACVCSSNTDDNGICRQQRLIR